MRGRRETPTMLGTTTFLALALGWIAQESDLAERVEHRYADNDGVRIHYVRTGPAGAEDAQKDPPLVVLIHGFPDYWYTWRHQIEALEQDFAVVAMDLRGYNRSDAPEGADAYRMPNLVRDVLAVVRDAGAERATIVGHDWGAAVAWQVAMHAPEVCERLVILSVPHPAGFSRQLASSEEQRKDSQYARNFQAPDSHESLTAEGLAAWVTDADARARYVEAFRRSSFDAMMNYYRVNYPRIESNGVTDAEPAAEAVARPASASWPRIRCPVLVLHGLDDRALHAGGHAGCWDWIDAETTLVMFPDAGHWVQHDQPERVSELLRDWLWRH